MISSAVMAIFIRFKDEEGQALAEYALILGFIAIVAVTALTLVGGAITGKLGAVAAGFTGGGSS